jgi:tetratricopeptide (TPR) repeat protein
MKSNNPRRSKKSSKAAEPVSTSAAYRWLIPAIIALATCAAFFPVFGNDFVEWDDYENLVSNPHYRGLGWSHLHWMFTTFHMGPYQPLSWATLGLDYLIWGMNPLGYHLTNLILHIANAVLFYFISRRLISLALPVANDESAWHLSVSAAFAALLFAIHPLRVESVAWATERRDVLSGLFFLSTVLWYVKENSKPGVAAMSWRSAAKLLAVYMLSLLAKASAMTLPVLLLIVDIYPLRRLPWNPRQWFAPAARPVLREKIPFVIVALSFAWVAVIGQQQASALRSLESYDIGSRVAQAFFGASFYLWKTLVPIKLSPLYEIPPHFSPWQPWILAGAAATMIFTLGCYLLRNRWPAGLACWLCSIVVLAPVLGIIAIGPQLVAERYSYLSCLSWAVLAGGLFLYWLRRSIPKPGALSMFAAAAAALVIVASLGVLTWQQTRVWRDTETLWSHVLKLQPNSSFAHYNLARFLAKQGKLNDAISHYRQALDIRPDDADSHNNLGLLLALRGDIESSLAEFQTATQINPNYARAFFNMGRVFARQGELEKAVQNYQQALQLDPKEIDIHLGLGAVLSRQGQLDRATSHFYEAVKLRPDFAEAHILLARALAAQGKKEEAETQYQQALQMLKSQNRSPPAP